MAFAAPGRHDGEPRRPLPRRRNDPLPEPADDRAAWEAAIGARLEGLEPGDIRITTELRGGPAAGELTERPYVIADVRVPCDSYPSEPGAEPERHLQAVLRTEADAVLIGAGALRNGLHARPLADPGLRDCRLAKGLARDPLGVVVARSGEPPIGAPAFDEPEAEVAVFTGAAELVPPCPAHVHVMRMPAGDLTPAVVMRRLRQEFGIRVLLYEGGPAMLAALGEAATLDEVLVTAAGAPPPDAGHLGSPLGLLVEAEPLWELAEGERRVVRFRARRTRG